MRSLGKIGEGVGTAKILILSRKMNERIANRDKAQWLESLGSRCANARQPFEMRGNAAITPKPICVGKALGSGWFRRYSGQVGGVHCLSVSRKRVKTAGLRRMPFLKAPSYPEFERLRASRGW
jgi:hypothetical protein